MRSTVIIKKRGEGYIATVAGKFGGGFQGARCGMTPIEYIGLLSDYDKSELKKIEQKILKEHFNCKATDG